MQPPGVGSPRHAGTPPTNRRPPRSPRTGFPVFALPHAHPVVFHVRKIESFDSPELQPYGTMRRQLEHREQGIFVAEGEKVVRRLLESTFIVVSVMLPEKWLRELEPLLQARPETVRVFVAEK